MEWLYIILGILVGLPLLVALSMFVFGLFLPERYEAAVTLVIDRKPDEVWAALADYQKNPMTGRMRKRTQPLDDVNGLPSWLEDMGVTQVVVVTESADPPRSLKRVMKDRKVPMTVEWATTIEEVPEGSRVTASTATVIRRGTWHVPFFRVMMKITGGGKATLRQFWKDLAKNLGAAVRFE